MKSKVRRINVYFLVAGNPERFHGHEPLLRPAQR